MSAAPLQRFTIEIASPESAAVDVFIRNLYDDEMGLRALVEHGAVSAAGETVGYDAIYPTKERMEDDTRVSELADYIERRDAAVARYAVVIGIGLGAGFTALVGWPVAMALAVGLFAYTFIFR